MPQEPRRNIFEGSGQGPAAPNPAKPAVNPFENPAVIQQLPGNPPGVPENPVTSLLSGAIDLLSRGQYASARFTDLALTDSENVLTALWEAGKEFVQPNLRLSYSDVIKRQAPNFAAEHPTATSALGFVGDVLLDPTTYLGLGFVDDGLRIGGKVLSGAGRTAVERASARIGADLAGVTLKRGSREARNLVAARTEEISQLFRGFGASDDAVKRGARQLAELETLTDIRRAERAGDDVAQSLAGPEIRERAEDRIARLFALDPEASKVFQSQNRAKLAFYPLTQFVPGKQVAVPLSEEVLNALGANALARQVRRLKDIQPVAKVAGLFSREVGIPTELVQLRKQLENELDYVVGDAYQTLGKVTEGLTVENKQAINKALGELEDRRLIAAGPNNNPITPGAAAQMQQIALSTLKPEERAAVVNMQQTYRRLIEIEKRADLLEDSVKRFDPKVYDLIADGTQYGNLRKFQLSPELAQSPAAGLVDNLASATAAGAAPDLDAFSLMAQRITAANQRQAIRHFSEAVETILPGGIKALPPRLAEDLKFVGDGLYGRGLSDSTKTFLQFYDAAMKPFRYAATVGKVAFGPKQLLFQNPSQVATEIGLKAYRTLDPRAAIDAGMILAGGRNLPSDRLPEFIEGLITRHIGGDEARLASRISMRNAIHENFITDTAQQVKIATPTGDVIPGTLAYKWAKDYGVVKGFNEMGDRIAVVGERMAPGDGLAKRVTGGLLRAVGSVPGMIEDYNRMMLFMNGLRMGYTPRASAEIVNRALFDYGRALSEFEQRTLRRLLPFFSYNRLAVPLALRKSVERPGTLTAPGKVYDVIGKLMGGETLSQGDREVLPDYLIEQPKVYRGLDAQGRAVFNLFGSTTLPEVLNLLVTNQDGSMNPRRTAEKTVLGQMTPFIKVPLELIKGKSFFTDDTIENATKLGDQRAGLSQYLPQMVKDAIGWEDRVNPRTGKSQTFINSYLAYTAMQYLPALKQFIRPLDDDKTALEKAMELVLGTATAKVDLVESARGLAVKERSEIKEARAKLIRAIRQDNETGIGRYQREWQDLVDAAIERRKRAGLLAAEPISEATGGIE